MPPLQGSGSHPPGAMIVPSVGQPRAVHSKCLSKIAHSEPAVFAAWESSWWAQKHTRSTETHEPRFSKGTEGGRVSQHQRLTTSPRARIYPSQWDCACLLSRRCGGRGKLVHSHPRRTHSGGVCIGS